MTEKLISFETAKLAKEQGFNIRIQHTVNGQNCLYFLDTGEVPKMINTNQIDNWNDDKKFQHVCSAPTQSLLQKWLREVHDINVIIYPELFNGEFTYYHYDIYTDLSHAYSENLSDMKTYEEALEKGLQKALKLIK